MTNEELVKEIKAGRATIEDLWNQTEAFIKIQAQKFYYSWQLRCDQLCVDTDDLFQVSYFALLEAVEKYDSNADMSFINYLATYQLRQQFYTTCKMRYKGWQNNTIYKAEPMTEALANTLHDSTDFAEKCINKIYQEQASISVKQAVNALTPNQKEIIQLIYFSGLTYQASAATLGVSKGAISASLRRSFAHLRKTLAQYQEQEVA